MSGKRVSPLFGFELLYFVHADTSAFQYISRILSKPRSGHHHKRVLGADRHQAMVENESSR